MELGIIVLFELGKKEVVYPISIYAQYKRVFLAISLVFTRSIRCIFRVNVSSEHLAPVVKDLFGEFRINSIEGSERSVRQSEVN